MKATFIGIITLFALPALAKPATKGAGTATLVAADGVTTPQIRYIGRLNVNTASREELQKVPSLDSAAIETILTARTQGEITDLSTLGPLPEESLAHLKTEGESNFFRIQQNPLVRVSRPITASAR
jgi:hypothetical protein